jgi:hypothetical protein
MSRRAGALSSLPSSSATANGFRGSAHVQQRFFKVANRATFSRILKREMATPEALARRREIVIDTIVSGCVKRMQSA